jgi:hypothetical protein
MFVPTSAWFTSQVPCGRTTDPEQFMATCNAGPSALPVQNTSTVEVHALGICALVGIGDTAEMAAFAAGLLMLTCTHLGVTNSKNPMIKPKSRSFSSFSPRIKSR